MADCQTCRFWKRGDTVLRDELTGDAIHRSPGPFGGCRKHAPRGPVVCGEGPSGSYADVSPFPTTFETDWCGEHEPPAPNPSNRETPNG